MITQTLDTLRRIAREPVATADLWGLTVASALALLSGQER